MVSKPMYGMPQPNSFGQYGFAGYGGFPTQGGTPAASSGMPQPAGAGAVGTGLGIAAGQPGADAAAAAGQAGQAQWGGADPNSYYSNYWGGECPV
jgi:nucleolysin TIA-1/TIAR